MVSLTTFQETWNEREDLLSTFQEQFQSFMKPIDFSDNV
jgi:hypothetical protein